MYEYSNFSTLWLTIVIIHLFHHSHPSRCEVCLLVVLICIFLMTSNIEHLFVLTGCLYINIVEIYIESLCLFLNWVTFIIELCSLNILDTSP